MNASIQKALDENKIPVEFTIMGFRPQPLWTAKTVLTRMPGWTLTRNASSEVQRAIDIKTMGIDKVLELKPTDPQKRFTVPAGLNLDDIEPGILAITREANNLRWNLAPPAAGARPSAAGGVGGDAARSFASAAAGAGGEQGVSSNVWQQQPDLGSNNWVIGGSKSVTGKPIIANDPHREIVNPVLRYVVHLEAPGWSAIGATEPGLPGISIGHNDRLAWGFTILGMDQQDLYVEETDPQNANRYMVNGEWQEMEVEKQLIWVKGKTDPVIVENKFTTARAGALREHQAVACLRPALGRGRGRRRGLPRVAQRHADEELEGVQRRAAEGVVHPVALAGVRGRRRQLRVHRRSADTRAQELGRAAPGAGQGQPVRVGRLRAVRQAAEAA